MKITRIDRTQAQHDTARANYFDGEVNTHVLVGPAQSNELDLLNVYFSAGARTRPHIHEQDQVLHIIEGRGIVATDAEKEFRYCRRCDHNPGRIMALARCYPPFSHGPHLDHETRQDQLDGRGKELGDRV